MKIRRLSKGEFMLYFKRTPGDQAFARNLCAALAGKRRMRRGKAGGKAS